MLHIKAKLDGPLSQPVLVSCIPVHCKEVELENL